MKTPSDETSDMISKRQLLVDGDAEASNSASRRSTADPFIYYENRHVDLGKLISHTKTCKLCFPVLSFSLFEHTQ